MTDSLLRCTIKKTTSVLGKHILWASCVIDALAAIVLAYFGVVGIWQVFGPVATSAVLAIPLWIYAFAVIVICYFGYGLVWCVARDLTDEDWQSERAKDISKTLALALAPPASTAAPGRQP